MKLISMAKSFMSRVSLLAFIQAQDVLIEAAVTRLVEGGRLLF